MANTPNIKTMKEVRNLYKEISLEVDKIKAGLGDQSRLQKKLTQDAKSQMDAAISGFKAGNLSHKGMKEIVGLTQELKKEELDSVDITNRKNDLQKQYNEALKNQDQKSADAYATQIGMLDTSEKRTAAELRSKQVMGGLDKITGGMASSLRDGLESMKGMPPQAIAVGAAIIVATAGIMAMWKLFQAIDGVINEVGENFGAIGTTNTKLFNTITDTRAEFIGMGLSAEDAHSAMEGLTGELGISDKMAGDMAVHVGDAAKSMGIGVDTASKLTSTLMSTSGHSAESAKNFIKSAGALAHSAKVAPKKVLQDMAEASEEVASFTKGTGENMVKAAIQARKMGMSLADLSNTAEGLLDFQSSISAEMEASAMLGRRVNLQKARELALSGDLQGMGKEILKQVGSEAEWNRLNVLQRRALAESVGVNVEQLSRLVRNNQASASGQITRADGKTNMEKLQSVSNRFLESSDGKLGKLVRLME